MKSGKKNTPTRPQSVSPLMVRLDEDSKKALSQAAELRQISVSDYVRTVTVAQAKREVLSAQSQSIALSPDEQLAFWQALQEPVRLTASQRRLGALMRGRK
jgi:uncharacterized protein (DUF1778 family)